MTQNDLDLFLYSNGKFLDSSLALNEREDVHLQLSLRLRGGKGGFGSMLRAIGAQIQKTTNREACRDLSGRRLRDVNEEKRIKEYIKRQADRKDKETKTKKEKLKKLADTSAPRNCEYDDDEFEKTREAIPEIIEDSIAYALKHDEKKKTDKLNQPSTSKTPAAAATTAAAAAKMTAQKRKNPTMWLGVDLDSDDSDDDSDESEPESSSAVSAQKESKTNSPKKQKVCGAP